MTEYLPIPGPTALPVLGNALLIDPEVPLYSLENLADTYGKFVCHDITQWL